MANKIYIRDLEILGNLQTELGKFNHGSNSVLRKVNTSLTKTKEYLQTRKIFWSGELIKREDELGRCQSDRENDRNCGAEIAAVREAQVAIEKLKKLSTRVERAIGEYQSPANRLKQLLDTKTSKAKGDLQHSVQKYQEYIAGAGIATGGKHQNLGRSQNPRYHYHHIYPKFRGNDTYPQFFEELGIDVDRWTVAVDEKTHLKYIHGKTKWNAVWKAWIDEHRGEVSSEEVLKFGRQLLTDFGIEGLWEGDGNPDPIGYKVPDSETLMKPNNGGGHPDE
ncbi:MAG: DUF2380 domain-containing protein [Candidatus Brocadiales bacterium]|nr:DUF2380 domain-containing protein [Candidatus Brocadiales bacterium]